MGLGLQQPLLGAQGSCPDPSPTPAKVPPGITPGDVEPQDGLCHLRPHPKGALNTHSASPLFAVFVELSLGNCPCLCHLQRQHKVLPFRMNLVLTLLPSLSVPTARHPHNSGQSSGWAPWPGPRACGGPPHLLTWHWCPRAPCLSLHSAGLWARPWEGLTSLKQHC